MTIVLHYSLMLLVCHAQAEDKSFVGITTDRIQQALKADYEEPYLSAIHDVIRAGKKCFPLIRTMLDNPKKYDTTVAKLITLLLLIADDASEFIPDARRALLSETGKEKIFILRFLVKHGGYTEIPLLYASLNDSMEIVRYVSIGEIGKIGKDADMTALDLWFASSPDRNKPDFKKAVVDAKLEISKRTVK